MSVAPGQTLSNQDLCQTFLCSPQGGMRRSLKTNSLVLISNHVESIYDDRWVGDVFHYTGMGQEGDQSLSFAQNRTLAESASNGVSLHLFEVERPKEYIYQGQVRLAGAPYTEMQPDQLRKLRRVYVFPLQLVEGSQVAIDSSQHAAAEVARQKKAGKLALDELRTLANAASQQPGERQLRAKVFERSPYVAEYARKRAGGKCELCGAQAPFNDRNDQPYLECHHIEWLSRGGRDATDNTVAVCPNCHRRLHVLDAEHDRAALQELRAKVP